VIGRHFGWLNELGYRVVESSKGWVVSATYGKGKVLVRPSYEERDDYVDVSIARRQALELGEEPFWAQVPLHELLRHRAASDADWERVVAINQAEAPLDTRFQDAADLLRTYAIDLLDGQGLGSLDEIIASRPARGVPGLDFPVEESWASSAEGLWFATDSELPRI